MDESNVNVIVALLVKVLFVTVFISVVYFLFNGEIMRIIYFSLLNSIMILGYFAWKRVKNQ